MTEDDNKKEIKIACDIKTAIINGKEYKLNSDGTPSFCVCLSGDEEIFNKSIKSVKSFYDFSYNTIYLDHCELLFIYSDNNILNKRQMADLFAANLFNIKTVIIYRHEKTGTIDNLLKSIETKVDKFYCKCDADVGKQIRSSIAKHSYGLKLLSDDWEKIKEKIKEDAGYKCQLCNSSRDEKILVVHHRTYDTQGTPDESKDLICLCKRCHEIVHEKILKDRP